jgi:butyryl-CoA dehydrogenase
MVFGSQRLAIQIHGGYGYTGDFPVEQYWRDNRLNMIHEGTHGIQAMDLLGRKVLMEGARVLSYWQAEFWPPVTKLPVNLNGPLILRHSKKLCTK